MRSAIGVVALVVIFSSSAAAVRMCCYDVGCTAASRAWYEEWAGQSPESLVSCGGASGRLSTVCVCREDDQPCDDCLAMPGVVGEGEESPRVLESVHVGTMETCRKYAEAVTCSPVLPFGVRKAAWTSHIGFPRSPTPELVPYCSDPDHRTVWRNCTLPAPDTQLSPAAPPQRRLDSSFYESLEELLADTIPEVQCACTEGLECHNLGRNPDCCLCALFEALCSPEGNTQAMCGGCCNVPTFLH